MAPQPALAERVPFRAALVLAPPEKVTEAKLSCEQVRLEIILQERQLRAEISYCEWGLLEQLLPGLVVHPAVFSCLDAQVARLLVLAALVVMVPSYQ